MTTLPELLTSDAKKVEVVEDCCALIDAEVKDKGGISGLAIKAGYATIKGIKPGFVKQVVSDLLPDFASALDPIYQDAKSQSAAVADFFANNATRVADALLTITDGKAQRSKSGVVKGTYDKLRGSAKKNVEAAAPRLGKMVEKYSPS
jgi:phage-related tail fiber protein